MTIDLTAEQCDAIESALAFAEVRCERSVQSNQKLCNMATTDGERGRCDAEVKKGLREAEFLESLRVMLMKTRVES